MKSELEARLQANIDRVRGLVLLYGRAAPGRGRSDVSSTDLLRAAVTFLHASCEDLIRGVTSWKLPLITNVERLAELPLGGVAGDDRPGPIKFDLQLLAEHHRQRTVRSLVPLMMRLHWIVHRLDRNRSSGRGQHVARSLARSTVDRWTKAAEDFGRDLLSRC